MTAFIAALLVYTSLYMRPFVSYADIHLQHFHCIRSPIRVIFTWGDKWFLHWVTFLISIFLKKIKKYLWSSPSLNMSWTKVVLMILYCILYYLCLHGSSLTYISFPAKRKENPNSRSACMCNYFMVIKCPTNSGWYKPYKIENVETVR